MVVQPHPLARPLKCRRPPSVPCPEMSPRRLVACSSRSRSPNCDLDTTARRLCAMRAPHVLSQVLFTEE